MKQEPAARARRGWKLQVEQSTTSPPGSEFEALGEPFVESEHSWSLSWEPEEKDLKQGTCRLGD
eukprot:284558-Prorocentrum_lima.AAC.1